MDIANLEKRVFRLEEENNKNLTKIANLEEQLTCLQDQSELNKIEMKNLKSYNSNLQQEVLNLNETVKTLTRKFQHEQSGDQEKLDETIPPIPGQSDEQNQKCDNISRLTTNHPFRFYGPSLPPLDTTFTHIVFEEDGRQIGDVALLSDGQVVMPRDGVVAVGCASIQDGDGEVVVRVTRGGRAFGIGGRTQRDGETQTSVGVMKVSQGEKLGVQARRLSGTVDIEWVDLFGWYIG